jgi:hypothetical protein
LLDSRLLDHQIKALKGVLPVLSLGPEPMGRNYHDAIRCQAVPGDLLKPFSNMVRQADTVLHVKTKLDCRGDFIDILAAGPGGMDKMEFNFLFINVRGLCIHENKYGTFPF